MGSRYVHIKRADRGRRRFRVLFRIGCFVVHRAVRRGACYFAFTVTHEPSGLACTKHMRMAPAKHVARVLAAMPEPWTRIRSRKDAPPGLTERARAALLAREARA